MSTEFTVALTAPDHPLPELFASIETALVERVSLQHSRKVLRCEWQRATGTFDEASPEQALSSATSPPELEDHMAGWSGFAAEFWNEAMLLYVLVARVSRPEGPYIDTWITISTAQLERLVKDDKLAAFAAVVAEVAHAVRATSGYAHFELTFEPLTPERGEHAIVDLPEYPGEPATLGILPVGRAGLADLERDYGQTFDILGTTAGYWVLTHRKLPSWLGA